jgi:N-acetylmuramoyl-L-alanine amidase
MITANRVRGCISLTLVSCMPAFAQEEAHPGKNSDEFNNSFNSEVGALIQRNFHEGLDAPPLGAATGADYVTLHNKIKTTWNTLGTERGDKNAMYDVILQPGHYRRQRGATGAGNSKLQIYERELAAYIVKGVAEALNKQGNLKVLVVDADHYESPLKSRVFLAIHADGSEPACHTAPSLSYHTPSSTLAMHAIGWGLSQALGVDYGKFHKDGFTANAARYYMYNKVDAPVMKGLLEVGEITCDATAKQLVVSADHIASNVARALSFILETSSGGTGNR